MARQARIRFLPCAIAAASAALVACGAATVGQPAGSPPPPPSAGAATTTTSPSPTQIPTPSGPVPQPTLAPAAAAIRTQTFSILPLVAGGPSGSVTVTTSGSTVRYHVVVTGLAPGSRHTIHDHLGRCSSAGASEHLTVLATAAANGSGVIDFQATVGSFLAGVGRIVIVYSNASPNLLTACADL